MPLVYAGAGEFADTALPVTEEPAHCLGDAVNVRTLYHPLLARMLDCYLSEGVQTFNLKHCLIVAILVLHPLVGALRLGGEGGQTLQDERHEGVDLP